MPKKTKGKVQNQTQSHGQGKDFHIEFMNSSQKIAWATLQKHDITFLIGPAGTAKTFISTAFAIQQYLSREKESIILTRPIVEAGESLGFLPGTFEEKVDPYMMPLYDSIDKLVGKQSPLKDKIKLATKVIPLAYMRGITMDNAVCILDEAQNATAAQLKLFLTRLGKNSKMIITGDPEQSDLPGNVALMSYVKKLKEIPGIGVVEFKDIAIVRHPLITQMLKKLEVKHDSIFNEELEPAPTMVDVYREMNRPNE